MCHLTAMSHLHHHIHISLRMKNGSGASSTTTIRNSHCNKLTFLLLLFYIRQSVKEWVHIASPIYNTLCEFAHLTIKFMGGFSRMTLRLIMNNPVYIPIAINCPYKHTKTYILYLLLLVTCFLSEEYSVNKSRCIFSQRMNFRQHKKIQNCNTKD